MHAWVWKGNHIFAQEENPTPSIEKTSVKVKIRAAGICTTDLEIIKEKIEYCKPSNILGHEIAGEVIELGNEVKNIEIGQRTIIDPSIGCGICAYRISGNKNVCLDCSEVALHIPSVWAEYIRVPEQNFYRLPDTVYYIDLEGTQTETLYTVLGGVEKLRPKVG